jgi:hypothetical protein
MRQGAVVMCHRVSRAVCPRRSPGLLNGGRQQPAGRQRHLAKLWGLNSPASPNALDTVLCLMGVLLEGLLPSGVWNVLTEYGMRMPSGRYSAFCQKADAVYVGDLLQARW